MNDDTVTFKPRERWIPQQPNESDEHFHGRIKAKHQALADGFLEGMKKAAAAANAKKDGAK